MEDKSGKVVKNGSGLHGERSKNNNGGGLNEQSRKNVVHEFIKIFGKIKKELGSAKGFLI